MIRDILGNRVKKHLSGFEQFYMEKFYIHNNKIYQIIRVKKVWKPFTCDVEVTYMAITPYNTKKVKRYSIPFEVFENRKYYTFLGKARMNISYK